MPREIIDIAMAKEELIRINGALEDPHLIIGGLAVNQYYVPRQSEDIDLICSHNVAVGLIKKLYPSDQWEIDEVNNDEYRPSFIITSKHKKEYGQIKFGPKIIERDLYENLDWKYLFEDAQAFKFKTLKLEKILVPCVEALAYTKLISACGRIDRPKSEKDFEDFVNLLNVPSFRINKLVGYFEKHDSTKAISKTAYALVSKQSDLWQHSPISYMFNIINGSREQADQQLDVNHSAIFSGNRNALGYSYEEIVFTEEISLFGDSKYEHTYLLRCDSGTIKNREHSYTLMEGNVPSTNGRVKTLEGSSKIKWQKNQSGASVKHILKFIPSLKPGDFSRYSILLERASGCYYMTQEDLFEAIKENKHPGNWPFESVGVTIKHPTKRLIMSVIFPDKYIPSDENNFSAYCGHMMEPIGGENKRLLEKGAFKRMEIDGCRVKLSLEIDYPLMGVSYALRWLPMDEDEYQELRDCVNK